MIEERNPRLDREGHRVPVTPVQQEGEVRGRDLTLENLVKRSRIPEDLRRRSQKKPSPFRTDEELPRCPREERPVVSCAPDPLPDGGEDLSALQKPPDIRRLVGDVAAELLISALPIENHLHLIARKPHNTVLGVYREGCKRLVLHVEQPLDILPEPRCIRPHPSV